MQDMAWGEVWDLNRSNQYKYDCTRLAEVIERYTNIPKERVFQFVMENGVTEILPSANVICNTDT